MLIEPSPTPNIATDGQITALRQDEAILDGWNTLWRMYRECLRRQGIDVTVPQRLQELLAATQAFENVVTHDGNIPVGFWPEGNFDVVIKLSVKHSLVEDEQQLTVGQLQWLDYDLLIPAFRPLFLSSGISESHVDRIVAEAQRDLYYPPVPLYAHIHVVYAEKRYREAHAENSENVATSS